MAKLRILLALGAFSAIHISSVVAQEAVCIPVCVSQFTANPSSYSCQDGGNACLCNNATFKSDVSACAWQGCSALDAQVNGYLDDVLCKDVASSTVATESAATTTTPVESSTAVSTTEAVTTSVTETTSEPTSDATSTIPPSSATPSATESSSEIIATTTSSEGPTNSSEVDEGNDAGASGPGLSKGAAVGIGVGVGVAALAMIAIAVALLLRRKRQQEKPSPRPVDISRPMPGGGRTYATPDHGSISEKRGGESFEMTSNRYEDMLPRTTPRTMV